MESRAHTSILLRLKRINIFLKLFLNKLWFFFFSLWFQDKILTRKVLFSVISCSRKWSTCSPDCGAIPLQIPVLNAPPLRCPSWDEFPLDVGDLNGVSRGWGTLTVLPRPQDQCPARDICCGGHVGNAAASLRVERQWSQLWGKNQQ